MNICGWECIPCAAGLSINNQEGDEMSNQHNFDYSAELHFSSGPKSRRNYELILEHTSAEWSGDVDGTMATMTRNEPFQIMYATGLDIRGWENIREFYRQRMTTYGGQSFFPQRWVASDEICVGTGYFSSAPNNSFFGIPAHGKKILIPMTIWFYFEDDLIKGEAAYLDGHELRRQIAEGASGEIKHIY